MCLQLVAHRDSITIDYSILPAFADMANLTAKVMLKGCYANSSQTDRPWRKSSPIIAKSKKCPFRAPSPLPVFFLPLRRPLQGQAIYLSQDDALPPIRHICFRYRGLALILGSFARPFWTCKG